MPVQVGSFSLLNVRCKTYMLNLDALGNVFNIFMDEESAAKIVGLSVLGTIVEVCLSWYGYKTAIKYLWNCQIWYISHVSFF